MKNLFKILEGTDTPGFRKWFGNSIMLDENGEPQKWYHGSSKTFSRFSTRESRGNLGAVFFTDSPEFAARFARWGNANIIPVYLSLKNLFQPRNTWCLNKLRDKLTELYPNGYPDAVHGKLMPGTILSRLRGGDYYYLEHPAIFDAVRKAGFDAIVVEEDGHKNVAVFDPKNVKSAIGNSGEFRRKGKLTETMNEWDSDNVEDLIEEEYYEREACAYFALALQDVYGYELNAMVNFEDSWKQGEEEEDDEEIIPAIIHIFCYDEKTHTAVDCRGRTPYDEFIRIWADDKSDEDFEVHEFSRQEILSWMGDDDKPLYPYSEKEVEDIRQYVKSKPEIFGNKITEAKVPSHPIVGVPDGSTIELKTADQWAAFYPNQIKSATGAKTFTPSKNILESIDPYFIRDENGPQKNVLKNPRFKKWFGKSRVTDDKGVPLRVFHGSTHSFDSFDITRSNKKAFWGKAFYFSNNTTEIGHNYATDGPDLRHRIEDEAEKIEYEWEREPEKFGDPDVEPDFMKLATERMRGQSDSTYPVYLRIENPFFVGNPEEPVWQLETEYDEEMGYEIETGGNGEEVLDAMYDAFYELYEGYGDRAAEDYDEVRDLILDLLREGAKADEIFATLRESDSDFILEHGSEFFRLTIQNLGYDGIIDYKVDGRFGSTSPYGKMAGMDPSTVHYIVFSPNQIKSAVGNNGNFSTSSDKITEVLNLSVGDIDIEKVREAQTKVFALGKPTSNPKTVVIDGFTISATPMYNGLYLSDIRNVGGTGATAFMKKVLSVTDSLGVDTFLFADPIKPAKLSKKQLTDWYSRLGYLPGNRGDMVRKAKIAERFLSMVRSIK